MASCGADQMKEKASSVLSEKTNLVSNQAPLSPKNKPKKKRGRSVELMLRKENALIKVLATQFTKDPDKLPWNKRNQVERTEAWDRIRKRLKRLHLRDFADENFSEFPLKNGLFCLFSGIVALNSDFANTNKKLYTLPNSVSSETFKAMIKDFQKAHGKDSEKENALNESQGNKKSSNEICENKVNSNGLTENKTSKDKKCEKKKKKRKITASCFKKVRTLGKGGMGTVELVKNDTNMPGTFAMKIVKKKSIKYSKSSVHSKRERRNLRQVQHPFIVKSFNQFCDAANVYMVMEFVQGGDLFHHVSRQQNSRLRIGEVFFYAACIVDALDYLHNLSIAYRDLKPENVLIDRLGYPKLADLGLSKKITNRSYSFVGTLDYLAPEIILKKGHNTSVDFWTFGILLYELILGVPPFKRNTSLGNQETMDAILHSTPDMTSLILATVEAKMETSGLRSSSIDPMKVHEEFGIGDHVSLVKPIVALTKDFILGLLKKSPKQRLGYVGGAQALKHHDYFSKANIIWEKLRLRKYVPIYLPDISGATDTKYFSSDYDSDDYVYTTSDDFSDGYLTW